MINRVFSVLFMLVMIGFMCCTDGPNVDRRENRAGSSTSVVEARPGAVNIYRDIYGVPHIYAAREEDGYWGLGYASAADRLHGILFAYLSIRGELAAHFGPGPADIGGSTGPVCRLVSNRGGPASYISMGGPVRNLVRSDIEARRWRHLDIARKNFSSLSSQTQANMKAYIAGIQRYLDDHPERVPEWTPELEPALPLAVSSFQMMVADLYPCAVAMGSTGMAKLGRQQDLALFQASNAWALAPDRTEEGAAIFSSDSHSQIEWVGTHLNSARIKAGTLDAWLLDPPGLPMGLKGHSRFFAWGITEGPRRPSDCVAVSTLADDPTAYRIDGIVKHMTTEPYVIKVKGDEPVRGVFEYTDHNGVLSPVIHRDGDTAYVVSQAYMGRAGFAVEQYREMLGARTSKKLAAALARREMYPANIIIAGADGSIHFIRPGRTPIRPDGADGSGVVDGSTTATAWKGIRAYDELLHIVDPSEGYLTNSNVSPDMMFAEPKIDPADYPPDFGFQPGFTGTRQLRSIQLLERDRKISFEEAIDIVCEAHTLGYEKWNEVFKTLKSHKSYETHAEDPFFKAFFESLVSFDGDFVPESRSALVHHMTRDALHKQPTDDALAVETAVLEGKPLTAAQQDLLINAVRLSSEKLGKRPDAASTTFGDLYRVGRGGTSEPARGAGLMLGNGMISFFPSGFVPVGEGGERFLAAGSRHPFLVQFTTPIRSMSAAAFGASDDPTSPHYSDQSALRGPGKLRPNYFNPEELAEAIESLQTFETDIPVDEQE